MCGRSASPHHLQLDTSASSTTNVKMKKLHIIAGLLIIGLLAQSGLAKSKSRNGRTQRQAYLPPRASSRPTITEEYITIHEEGPGGRSPFHESNYGDGKYQVFEIHSHYEPSVGAGAGQAHFNAPGYLPPQPEIRVEHIHQAPNANGNRLNLGSNGARGGVHHSMPIAAPAPVAPAAPVPFPSSYQHGFSNVQSGSVGAGSSAGHAAPAQEEVIRVEHFHISQLQNSAQQTGFKAPDYLPPHVGNVGVPNSQSSVPSSGSEYRAPDYLPPHQEHTQSHPVAGQTGSHHQQFNSFAQHQQEATFKGPDYLPPHSQHHHSQQNVQFPAQHSEQFKGPDYLPPHQENHNAIAHQHVEQHQPVSHANPFKGPDYLPPHQGQHSSAHHAQYQGHHHEQQNVPQEQTAYKGPDYLPPHQGPHNSAHNTHHQGHHHEQQNVPQEQSAYKGPDYLPPHQGPHAHHQGHHHEQQNVPQEQTAYRGPDYLPPHQGPHNSAHNAQHQGHHHEQQNVPQEQSAYKGPDYLPPHQGHQAHHQNSQPSVQHLPSAFKGPDYLPPHQAQHEQHHETHQHHEVHQHHEAHQQHQQQQNNFKAPDYLPPHQGHQQNVQQQISQQSNPFKGPDYLPPHQAVQGHHQSIGQHVQQQQTPFKGPDYLPPHQTQHHHENQQINQHFEQQHHAPQQSNAFRAPDYLPPHHEQHIGHNEIQHQTHSGAPQPGSLPGGYEPQIPAVPVAPAPAPQPAFQHPLPQPAPQYQHEPARYQAPSSLPQGYDFEKPPNAEQAIAELHTLPEEHPEQQEVVVQSQIQVSQGQQQADIIYGSHQSGVNYQTNGYLPPQQSSGNYQGQQANVQVAATAVGAQQNVQQYQQGLQQVAPQTFTPTPAAPVAQAPVTNYLPPATPVQAHQYGSSLHSLSSYMTSVQPFQRYASAPRQPFREYGPPPAAPAPNHGAVAQQQQQQYQQPQPLPVAPMYREQASRPPYYAPAMSYTKNAVANSYAVHHTTAQQQQHIAFNQQTQQNLQQFMPSDVRRPSPVAVPAPAPVAISAPAPKPAAIHTAPAVPVRQLTSSKIRTVQIVNPAAVKTLKVLETSDHTGVKTIKILGHSNTQPTGDHHVVKVVTQNAPNAHEHVQTVKIFNDHEEAPNLASAGGNAYLPPSARVARQTPLKLQLLSNEKFRRPFTGRRRYRF